MRLALPALALALLALLPAAPAHAAESYDSCTGYIDSLPAVLTTKGVWCLRADLNTALADGVAIDISGNNITVDCNNFRIGGLAAGAGTTSSGISISGWLNATVRNCRLRGFYRAIYSANGGNHLFEDNELDGNTYAGIWSASDGVTIRRNRVLDTGGSSISSSETFGIFVSGTADVIDNTISAVQPINASGSSYGIAFVAGGNGSASDNRIRGLSTQPGAQAVGIYVGGFRMAITGNIVQGAGQPNGYGISCIDASSTAQGNILSAFTDDLATCQDAGNYINDL